MTKAEWRIPNGGDLNFTLTPTLNGMRWRPRYMRPRGRRVTLRNSNGSSASEVNAIAGSSDRWNMATFFINTDATSNEGESYHDEWLARGIAVTSGPVKFRDKIARIGRGDVVLIYANGVGLVAAGTALDDEVIDVTDKARFVSQSASIEYHRRVDWHSDLRSNPISLATLWELCGRPPRQTVERAHKGEDTILQLIGKGRDPRACDLAPPPVGRVETIVSRIVRDTALAKQVKALHGYECQICGHTIRLADGSRYAEGHHIRPLGVPHNGPDVPDNIICLCPNHHAECDLGAIRLDAAELRKARGHSIDQQYIDYHNESIVRG